MSIFAGRSLAVIDDFTIEERKYLFELTRRLKQAYVTKDEAVLAQFRINNPNLGVYEIFQEDSTRTKESFRNAINFHRVKVNDLAVDTSSMNKGESYADTLNTLTGYDNSIFIIRSKTEGVCRWLEDEAVEFAKRNQLDAKPIFINGGDGKHEHPTQELLDEFTFLEDNQWSTDEIHLALVGDLYHGRTVHSKADGLRIFSHVKVDLIAPVELAMPEAYVTKMVENGFIVRQFNSIDEYLAQKDVALKWYFTRPQLERMGDRILARQEELRDAVTFKRQYLQHVNPDTKLYHPLPRHRLHPTIPTFLDETPLNGWERQSINGMYVRIVLLSLLAGKIGHDFVPQELTPQEIDEEYIVLVKDHKKPKLKEKDPYSEGVRPIRNGIVIDHIGRGEEPTAIRRQMVQIIKILALDGLKGGEWVSTSNEPPHLYKGIIFRPDHSSDIFMFAA
jgi:aspartate carbamoyltransferase